MLGLVLAWALLAHQVAIEDVEADMICPPPTWTPVTPELKNSAP